MNSVNKAEDSWYYLTARLAISACPSNLTQVQCEFSTTLQRDRLGLEPRPFNLEFSAQQPIRPSGHQTLVPYMMGYYVGLLTAGYNEDVNNSIQLEVKRRGGSRGKVQGLRTPPPLR